MLLPIIGAVMSLSCLPQEKSSVEGNGRHQRIESGRGPVHVFCTEGAAPELLVLYVHGYFDSVDDAHRSHGLIEQFEASGVPAVFVMIEAPKGPQERVRWSRLKDVRALLKSHLAVEVPDRVVAMGHSGGNRTLREWSEEGLVKHVILLDAFYGAPKPWTSFLEKVPDGTLTLVGVLTFGKADRWWRALALRHRGRVAHFRAQTSHMGVVTDGVWIPSVLAGVARKARI
jgi:hypothetical protein